MNNRSRYLAILVTAAACATGSMSARADGTTHHFSAQLVHYSDHGYYGHHRHAYRPYYYRDRHHDRHYQRKYKRHYKRHYKRNAYRHHRRHHDRYPYRHYDDRRYYRSERHHRRHH